MGRIAHGVAAFPKASIESNEGGRAVALNSETNMTSQPQPTTENEHWTRTLRQILPPYAVILHNDEEHAMDFVVDALVKSVSSLSRDEAIAVMFEAHELGRAVVIVCPLEHAELYRDRIKSYKLGVTIEDA